MTSYRRLSWRDAHRSFFSYTALPLHHHRPAEILSAFEQAAYIFHSLAPVDADSIGAVELASILELSAPAAGGAVGGSAAGTPPPPPGSEEGGAAAADADSAAAPLSVQHVAEAQALLQDMCAAVSSESDGALTKMEFMRTYLDPECAATADIDADFTNLFRA